MATKTAIAWTLSKLLPESLASFSLAQVAGAVRLEVPQFVAGMAKRYAVVHVVSKFRKLGHRLFVVGAQVAASIVAAIPAAIAVARKHCLAPDEIFRLPAQAEVARKRPAFPRRMRGAARRSLSCGDADLGPRFERVLLAKAQLQSLLGSTHAGLCFFAVLPSLKPRRLSKPKELMGAWGHRAATLKTRSVSAVGTGTIITEIFSRLPELAARAMVNAVRNARAIFVERNARPFSGGFHGAI